MDKRLSHIAVRSVVPVAAAIHFVLGALTALALAIGVWLLPVPVTSLSFDGPVSLSFTRVPPAFVFVLFPFLSAVAGAAVSALAAWIYNALARRVGPLRITLSD